MFIKIEDKLDNFYYIFYISTTSLSLDMQTNVCPQFFLFKKLKRKQLCHHNIQLILQAEQLGSHH